jgi:Peptidase_C39 like family
MVRTPTTFLSAISSTRTTRSALLALAALGVGGAIALTPTAAHADEGTSAAPAARVASYDGALQPNGYYCGPAATRIALTAHGMAPSFDSLAGELATTTDGTKSINEIARVLNAHVGARYQSVEMSGSTSSPEQTEKLRKDVVSAITEGDAVVANIAGTVTDTAGASHSYEGGHYLTVTGYADEGRTVTVTDPADRVGSNEYQLPVDWLANWIATRGYSA